MALATSAGTEGQRHLATVVIGGLMTSTGLTLLISKREHAEHGVDLRRAMSQEAITDKVIYRAHLIRRGRYSPPPLKPCQNKIEKSGQL